jgi:hypothetical protein
MRFAVRRFFESLAWLLIGLMFLYTILQSLGVVEPIPDGDAFSGGSVVSEQRAPAGHQ